MRSRERSTARSSPVRLGQRGARARGPRPGAAPAPRSPGRRRAGRRRRGGSPPTRRPGSTRPGRRTRGPRTATRGRRVTRAWRAAEGRGAAARVRRQLLLEGLQDGRRRPRPGRARCRASPRSASAPAPGAGCGVAGGAPPRSASQRTSSSSSKRRWPPGVRTCGTRPAAAQARSDDELTPSSRAAADTDRRGELTRSRPLHARDRHVRAGRGGGGGGQLRRPAGRLSDPLACVLRDECHRSPREPSCFRLWGGS